MKKRVILRFFTLALASVALLISISSTIQYFSSKQIQAHSVYKTGTVTKLNAGPNGYSVRYTFTPYNSDESHEESENLPLSQYVKLRIGNPISVYYDTQKPDVQTIAGYQSNPKSLGLLSIISGFAFLILALLTFRLKKQNSLIAASTTNSPVKKQSAIASPATTEPVFVKEISNSDTSRPVQYYSSLASLTWHGLGFGAKQGILRLGDGVLSFTDDRGNLCFNVPLSEIIVADFRHGGVLSLKTNEGRKVIAFFDVDRFRNLSMAGSAVQAANIYSVHKEDDMLREGAAIGKKWREVLLPQVPVIGNCNPYAITPGNLLFFALITPITTLAASAERRVSLIVAFGLSLLAWGIVLLGMLLWSRSYDKNYRDNDNSTKINL